ncbi:MAG TPA: hypothetical protein VFB36_05755 [Nevskiaceae bacterium]|nr:hypothetical protein [Nevskiaceae bacterium]
MNVSYRRAAPAVSERHQRDEAWSAAPTIRERFPRARRFAIAMSFRDPHGAATPSPMRQLYEPSMRAIFEQRCPVRDCTGGGFDLNGSIRSMLSNDRLPRTGQAACRGSRFRGGECGLELSYSLTSDAV